MRPLYWVETPSSRPVIRGTYFVRSGDGWLPYSEADASALEVGCWAGVGLARRSR